MKPAISYSFFVDSNVLVVKFLEPDSDSPHEYDISPVRMLAETMLEDGVRSQLVFHLGMKSWASKPFLYDFAAQVVKYHPDNKIDWRKSFFDIEIVDTANNYADANYKYVHTSPEDLADGEIDNADRSDHLMLQHQTLQDLRQDEGKLAEIRLRVDQELKKRGII